MEIKKEKCSCIDHKEIEANCFCIICQVYMCHKCESFHSKLCQHHKIINSNEINIKESYSGFCKEKNHQSELDYYCKTHNQLVCAKCIVKINGKNNGTHANCSISTLDDIKNEKINNLKNNINILENLSNSLQDSINNLKKIFENISEKKEQMKIKAQKLFTKIRNELNIREEQLLSEIDIFFENNYFKDEIIKDSEKLPNRIKLALEKNKDNNKNKDINTIINNCIMIENNINDINNINQIVEKANNSINNKINLTIDNEEEINKLLSTIKSLGNISFIAEKYTFKFNPNLGTNYKISENGLIATKKKQEFDDWDCAILGDTEIPKNEISKWKIKLKYICDYKMNSWSILIGIGPNYDGSKNFHHKCWSFICGECSINNKNKVSRSIMNKTRLKSGSVIEVIVDRPKGNLSFVVNGNNCGIVCNEIPKDVILFPFVSIYDSEQIVEIIE